MQLNISKNCSKKKSRKKCTELKLEKPPNIIEKLNYINSNSKENDGKLYNLNNVKCLSDCLKYINFVEESPSFPIRIKYSEFGRIFIIRECINMIGHQTIAGYISEMNKQVSKTKEQTSKTKEQISNDVHMMNYVCHYHTFQPYRNDKILHNKKLYELLLGCEIKGIANGEMIKICNKKLITLMNEWLEILKYLHNEEKIQIKQVEFLFHNEFCEIIGKLMHYRQNVNIIKKNRKFVSKMIHFKPKTINVK